MASESNSQHTSFIYMLAGVLFAAAAYFDAHDVAFYGIGIMFFLFGLTHLYSRVVTRRRPGGETSDEPRR